MKKKHYKITQAIESDGTWIRLYEDDFLCGTFMDSPDGIERAYAKLESLKNPPPEKILYEEGEDYDSPKTK